MENLTPAELYKHVAYVWLAVGVIFLVAEAIGISGVGFLFAGLSALVVGAVVHMGWIAQGAHILQFTVFFAAVAVWAGLLWKPIQKFRKPASGYSNIIGETAYVGSSGLSKQSGGEVTWSGTIMKAQLVKHAKVESLDAGSQVVIVEVSGATLIVKPKE